MMALLVWLLITLVLAVVVAGFLAALVLVAEWVYG